MGSTSGVVLITGASSGIGRETANYLAGKGFRVYGTSRRAAPEDLPVTMLRMDVTDDESVRAGVAHVLSAENGIDVVVNNAGYSLAGPIEDTTVDEAKRQLDTNFFGAVRVIQAVLPHMRQRRRGKIINISSLGGLVGMPFQAFYSASKFAIEGLTEALRLELAPFGIEVVNVNPGDVRTPMTTNRITAGAAGNGAYSEQFARTLHVYERDEKHGAEPILVAQLIERLMQTRSPRIRYLVGTRAQTTLTLLKHFIGARRFEKMMMDHCRIRPSGPDLPAA